MSPAQEKEGRAVKVVLPLLVVVHQAKPGPLVAQ